MNECRHNKKFMNECWMKESALLLTAKSKEQKLIIRLSL